MLKSLLIALVDSLYSATYRSLEAKEPENISGRSIECYIFAGSYDSSTMVKILTVAESMALSTSHSRDLVNMPSNLKSTLTMVQAARSLSDLPHVQVEVMEDPETIRKQMPAFYAVALGSLATDPPRFIHVIYKPTGEISRKIALVGKSVIFDTGGYQLKPGESMITMKGDMTGGAFVLGTIRALANLGVQNLEVHAYLAATPNKIDSGAMIPDFVVESASGKKIEIRNTDAEGRLTLIDAVWKALEIRPAAMITVATLTGSAKRCLGDNIALLANREEELEAFEKAAHQVGDPIQRLNIIDEDFDDIKSKLDSADLINVSRSKTRGTQTAAAFVMSATPDDVIHLHLDIAGVDVGTDEKATGIGQKALIAYLLSLSEIS